MLIEHKKHKLVSSADVIRAPGPPHGSHRKYEQYSVAGVPNLYLLVYRSGARSYQFRQTLNGRGVCKTIGAIEDCALDRAIAITKGMKFCMKAGQSPYEYLKSTRSMTVSQFVADKYMPFIKLNRKSRRTVENMLLKRILPHFGDLPLTAITKGMIRDFLNAILDEINLKTGKKIGAASYNRHLSLLASLYTLAGDHDLVEKNPCIGIRKQRENSSRDRYLSSDEYPKFIKALMSLIDRPQAKAILLLAVLGLRPSEILNLSWNDIRLADQQIFLRDCKNGENRLVALNSVAMDVIQDMEKNRDATSPWLFPSNSKSGHLHDVRKTFSRICKQAGITEFNLYDLRRSHGTQLLRSGVNPIVIKEVLGHKSLKSTLVYARVPSESMAQANELAAKKFKEVINSNNQAA